jgi:hypothetical protein
MKTVGAVFFCILALFLLLGAFREPIADGIKGWRTEEQAQGATVTTGAGATTANVTLTADLFQDDTAEVTDISSNISGESPAASTYTAATNVLLVSGLNSSATHALVITYNADPESAVMAAVGPFLGILIFGGLIVAILYGAFKGRR